MSPFLKKCRISSIDRIIKCFTWKDANAAEISKELDSVYKDNAPFYRIVVKCLVRFKHLQRAFEDSSRTNRPSTITTDQSIQAVQQIVMHDRQISICHIDYELSIPTTTIYEIMSKYLGIKKASIRWVRKLFSSIQHVSHLDCCQEFLQENEVNPDNYFRHIVTGDET